MLGAGIPDGIWLVGSPDGMRGAAGKAQLGTPFGKPEGKRGVLPPPLLPVLVLVGVSHGWEGVGVNQVGGVAGVLNGERVFAAPMLLVVPMTEPPVLGRGVVVAAESRDAERNAIV